MPELQTAISALLNNQGVSGKKVVLIISKTMQPEIVECFLDNLREKKNILTIIRIQDIIRPGQEPILLSFKSDACYLNNATLTQLVNKQDISIALTNLSISHIQAHKALMEKGGYVISLPGFSSDWLKPLATSPEEMELLGQQLLNVIGKNECEVNITSPYGTNLKLWLPDNNWNLETGRRISNERGTNGVGGELYSAPKIGGAQGIYVLPKGIGCATNPINMVDQDIILTIANGMVVNIEGKGKSATKLRAMLKNAYKHSRNPHVWQIAEFALQLNRNAPERGISVLVEKKYGGIHIAIGSNGLTLRGGEGVSFIPSLQPQAVGVHIDCITFGNTVTIDGKTIMKDGEYVI